MACQSCGQKQHSANKAQMGNVYSFSAVDNTEDVQSLPCTFTKDQIVQKLEELKTLFGEKNISNKDRKNLSINIFRLNRVLRYYDANCNQFLNDLNEILG